MAGSLLDRRAFFVRERVAFMKFSDTYDILDLESQAQIGLAQEKAPGWVHVLRFLVNKRFLPTTVRVHEADGPENPGALLFSIERGFSFLRPRVAVRDAQGALLGSFQSKLFSLGGAFFVLDPHGEQVAMLKGDWKGWNFRFLDRQEQELGSVTKKWAGLGKELFTSADNYVISLNGQPDARKATLLLAGGLAVDTIFKENK